MAKNTNTAVAEIKGVDRMLELEQLASELQPYQQKLQEMGNSL